MTKQFQPVAWSHNTNIYEVNLRQYTPEGTINAFANHLPRLYQMGVKTLWFMPITPIAQKNKKGSLGSYYACSDYTAVSPEFGTIEDFKALVEQAHRLGFTVILDWVANHTGWDHRWTREHPEYYEKDTATQDFKIASGMDDIIELDFRNQGLRRAMIDAMKFWVKSCGIDGFRCDLAFWVELDFWREARNELDAVKPLFWLGEFDELEKPEYGEVFDTSYSWSWMHKTEEFYKQHQPLDTLLSLLKKYDDLGYRSMRAWFTTNHDENSWNGTEYEKYGDMAKTLAVFSATWNGIPLIYSGQELPNRRRLLFFEKDPIQWTAADSLNDFYKALLTIKTNNPALRAGDASVQTFRIKTNAPGQVFTYLRKNGNNEVLVTLNLSPQPVNVELQDTIIANVYTDIFTNRSIDLSKQQVLSIPAWGYVVAVQ